MLLPWLLLLAGLLGCSNDVSSPTRNDAGDPGALDAASADASRVVRDAAPRSDARVEVEGDAADGAPVLEDAAVLTDSGVQDAGDADAGEAATRDASAGDAAVARSCKRGVAYNNEQAADSELFGTTIGWWYDWGSKPSTAASKALEAAGVEFVPMVWTGPPRSNIDVQALIADIPQSARYLLGFNEPNFGSQANLTPEQAAAAWPQLEQIAKARNLKLVSPAVNYCGGSCNQTDPFKWLDAFFAACKDCQVDYVAFHWYACSLDALKSFVGQYASKYGKPLWLTEFACLDDPGDHSAAGQLAYLRQAVPFLEADPRVFRYAWFIGRSSQASAYDLFASAGKLTTLGSDYASQGGTCE